MWLAIQNIKLYFVIEIVIASNLAPDEKPQESTSHFHCGMGPVWPPWGRGRPPGRRVAAVVALPAPWDPCGCRGGVAVPLGW